MSFSQSDHPGRGESQHRLRRHGPYPLSRRERESAAALAQAIEAAEASLAEAERLDELHQQVMQGVISVPSSSSSTSSTSSTESQSASESETAPPRLAEQPAERTQTLESLVAPAQPAQQPAEFISVSQAVQLLRSSQARGKLARACTYLVSQAEDGEPFRYPPGVAGKRVSLATLRQAVLEVDGATLPE
jgi:hypothetical protein